jgi:modulator of FtsH protease
MADTLLVDWQGFFEFVGLVAGGLTGLIFVALSIQIAEVRARGAYATRARTTLDNLTGIVVLSGLALIPGQTETAFAIEAAIVLAVLIWDIVRTLRAFEQPGVALQRPVVVRTTLALGTLVLGLVGCAALLIGNGTGLLLIGIAALLALPVRIVQAWALLEASLHPSAPTPAAEPSTPDANG